MSFGGVDFFKLGVVCKKLMVDWVIGYDVWKWSSVQKQTKKTAQVPTLNPVEHQTWLEKKRKQNCWQQRTDFCPEGTIETTGEW